MEKARLPKTIWPERLAKARREISGYVALAELTRLSDLLAHNQGDVFAKMTFGFDREKFVVVDIVVEGTLPLVCQQTLKTFDFPVRVEVSVSPVADEQIANILPAHLEPFITEEEEYSPLLMIEDELLLVMPLVPVAPVTSRSKKPKVTESREADKRHKPFEGLTDLLKKG